MHKCSNCGQEYEGKFCPNCGAQWQEEKTCPECGAKLLGSARFCNECGYSFVKSEEIHEQKASSKPKLKSVGAWIKSHLKIVVPVVLAVVLVIILACSIPACIAAQNNGTYYKLRGGEPSEDNYIILSSGKWEDNEGSSGTYKIDGENIVFYVDFFGTTQVANQGTLKNHILTIEGGTFVSEKHSHNFGEWETTREATCISGGMQTRTCDCGVKETQHIPSSDTLHKIENPNLVDSEYHSGFCSVCEKEVKQPHGGDNCVCGYPYKFELDDIGSSYKLYRYYNTSTQTFNMPSTYKGLPITSIDERAFDGCSGLTSITIPDSVTSIGDKAFCGCSGLTSITIPDSVTSIGDKAFAGCRNITSINYTGDITSWCKISGLSFIMSSNRTLYINGAKLSGDLTIPDGVTSIGAGAFKGCTELTSIKIPSSVTSIGDYAFSGCNGLTSVTIPNGVTSIGERAFSGCSGLTSVTIGNGVTSIGYSAFEGCSGLTSITIPDSVTSIGYYAFGHCSNLMSVTIPDSVTTIDNSAFEYCGKLSNINFEGTKEQWKVIKKGKDWNYMTGKYIVHCTDGDIEK